MKTSFRRLPLFQLRCNLTRVVIKILLEQFSMLFADPGPLQFLVSEEPVGSFTITTTITVTITITIT